MSSLTPTEPAQRSTFVTTLAWMVIVPSALGVVISTLQNILVFTVIPVDQMALPTGPGAEHMPPIAVFLFGHIRAVFAAAWLLMVASLATGIGLLKRKEWARLLFIALLGLSILGNIGGFFVQQSAISTISAMPEAPSEFRAQFESMATTMQFVSIAMAVGFSAVSGWLMWRLASGPVKAEFGAAP